MSKRYEIEVIKHCNKIAIDLHSMITACVSKYTGLKHYPLAPNCCQTVQENAVFACNVCSCTGIMPHNENVCCYRLSLCLNSLSVFELSLCNGAALS